MIYVLFKLLALKISRLLSLYGIMWSRNLILYWSFRKIVLNKFAFFNYPKNNPNRITSKLFEREKLLSFKISTIKTLKTERIPCSPYNMGHIILRNNEPNLCICAYGAKGYRSKDCQGQAKGRKQLLARGEFRHCQSVKQRWTPLIP